jgi:hypothetical protein
MNRLAAGSPAFARGADFFGADKWGLLSLLLLGASLVALGAALYLLIKSGRGPFPWKRKPDQKPPHADRRGS